MTLYKKAAARANGTSQSWIVRRTNEVHYIAMGHVVDQIRKLCMPRPYLFTDGKTRMGIVRPAFFMGDQPGQDKHLAKTTKGCGVCMAPADKLDSTEETFLLETPGHSSDLCDVLLNPVLTMRDA